MSRTLSRSRSAMRRNMVNSAARGTLRAFRVSNANLRFNRAQQSKVANAITILVGALQDFMLLSGQPLSRAVHKTIVNLPGQAINSALAGKPIGGALRFVTGGRSVGRAIMGGTTKVASAVIGGIPVKFVVALLKKYAVEPYELKSVLDDARLERIVVGSQKSLRALIEGKVIDLRPLVSNVIMAMDPVDVTNLARGVLNDVLNQYVYSAYKSSGSTGPGAMCGLCRQATSCAADGKTFKANRSRNGQALRAIVERALRAVNMLLSIQKRPPNQPPLTVSSVAHQAMLSKLPTFMQMPPVRAAAGLAVGAAMQVIRPFASLISGYSATMGVYIDTSAVQALLSKHWKAVGAWLASGKANIEPFILDVVGAVRPLGVVRGAVSQAINVKGKATTEFCALCQSVYSTCAVKRVS